MIKSKKANKAHECNICNALILAGDTYYPYISSQKICKECFSLYHVITGKEGLLALCFDIPLKTLNLFNKFYKNILDHIYELTNEPVSYSCNINMIDQIKPLLKKHKLRFSQVLNITEEFNNINFFLYLYAVIIPLKIYNFEFNELSKKYPSEALKTIEGLFKNFQKYGVPICPSMNIKDGVKLSKNDKNVLSCPCKAFINKDCCVCRLYAKHKGA